MVLNCGEDEAKQKLLENKYGVFPGKLWKQGQ